MTTNAQHTPGPWRVVYYDCGDRDYYDHNGPCPSVQAPDDQDCAIVHWDGFKQKYWSSANGNQKQIEANARLIAAAPELLEALDKYADDLCEGWCEKSPDWAHFDDCAGCLARRTAWKARGAA